MRIEKLKGFIYDGAFPLDFLQQTESVRAGDLADKGSCEINTAKYEKTYPISLGDCVARDAAGEILVIGTSGKKK